MKNGTKKELKGKNFKRKSKGQQEREARRYLTRRSGQVELVYTRSEG